jgi:uncharacterized protein YaeQ
MTKDEIIKLAKQAGFERLGHDDHDYVCYPDEIVAFAKLVAAKEREACALIADTSVDYWVKAGYPESAEAREAMTISEDIRDRGQE